MVYGFCCAFIRLLYTLATPAIHKFKVQGSTFQVWFTVYRSIFAAFLEGTRKELGRRLEEG